MDDLISRQAAIATAISGRVRTLPTTEDGEDWIRVNEVRDSLLSLPSAERHEPITSEMDEIFRIASEIRLAVGCNTSRECWELVRKGDIQRVRHGRWIMHIDDLFPKESTMECDQCHEEQPLECDDNYCPNCGAKMTEE